MKPSIVTLLAFASISLMLAAPAHAQWVAGIAQVPKGTTNDPNSYANYSPGASASSTGPGATVSGGTFECNFSTGGFEPANSGCSADAGYGGSWVITYTWQGSGTGPSFVVPIQAEAHGLTSFSGTAGGGCGADADGYYNTNGSSSFNDPTETNN